MKMSLCQCATPEIHTRPSQTVICLLCGLPVCGPPEPRPERA